jgi:hypothetical protein
MKTSLRWFLALCLGGALCWSAAGAEFVVVSATAAPGYNRTLPEGGGIRPESYTFMEGMHLGGKTRDATMEKTQFSSVLQLLAKGLAQQKYFPATNPKEADLVIVVHWGTTLTYEEPMDKQIQTERLNEALSAFNSAVTANGIADPGEVNQNLAESRGSTASQEGSIARNAKLLGYQASLEKEYKRGIPGPDELTMKSELAEERYFAVLMAYDYNAMKRDRKSRLVWVTHMSVRSPGNNFAEAMPMMVNVAANAFGKTIDGLQRTKADLKASVDIGTPIVIGPTDEPKK